MKRIIFMIIVFSAITLLLMCKIRKHDFLCIEIRYDYHLALTVWGAIHQPSIDQLSITEQPTIYLSSFLMGRSTATNQKCDLYGFPAVYTS